MVLSFLLSAALGLMRHTQSSFHPHQPYCMLVMPFYERLILFLCIPNVYTVNDVCVRAFVCADSPSLCSKRTNYGCLCSFNACKCQERNIAPHTTESMKPLVLLHHKLLCLLIVLYRITPSSSVPLIFSFYPLPFLSLPFLLCSISKR